MVSVLYPAEPPVQFATPGAGSIALVLGGCDTCSSEAVETGSGGFERRMTRPGFLGSRAGAVAFGGFGALAVTAVWAWLFPRLRTADRLV